MPLFYCFHFAFEQTSHLYSSGNEQVVYEVREHVLVVENGSIIGYCSLVQMIRQQVCDGFTMNVAGRSEVDFTYSVGFDDSGRISVLDVRLFNSLRLRIP